MGRLIRRTAIVWIFLSAASHCAFPQGRVPTWFPSRVGDTWVYQNEDRDGTVGGIAHPEIERWRIEETIVSSATIPEGTLFVKRVRALDPKPPDHTNVSLTDSHYLMRGECAYVLDGYDAMEDRQAVNRDNQLTPEIRNLVLRADIPANFCFPLAKGQTWGKVPSTSPAGELVWKVIGVNGTDPASPDRGTTYHLSSYLGSGTAIDVWFEKGIGVVRENIIHNGTYEEHRRQLLLFKPAPER